MIYYAIADLHGRYDLLDKALDVIDEDVDAHNYSQDFTKIITLGDYIDRGPESNKIINFLIKYSDNENFISLKGNHEDIMVQAMRKPNLLDWWFSNGGRKTVESYGSMDGIWDTSPVNPEHVSWMANLPLCYETEKHVFVHAGVPTDDLDLDNQDPEELLWMLYGKNDQGGYRGKHVVHGHHQFADGPHEYSGRTDLDTFAWKTGRLVVGVFSDEQHGALRFLEVKGDEHGATRGEDLNYGLLLSP